MTSDIDMRFGELEGQAIEIECEEEGVYYLPEPDGGFKRCRALPAPLEIKFTKPDSLIGYMRHQKETFRDDIVEAMAFVGDDGDYNLTTSLFITKRNKFNEHIREEISLFIKGRPLAYVSEYKYKKEALELLVNQNEGYLSPAEGEYETANFQMPFYEGSTVSQSLTFSVHRDESGYILTPDEKTYQAALDAEKERLASYLQHEMKISVFVGLAIQPER